jgi:hypothetical protein
MHQTGKSGQRIAADELTQKRDTAYAAQMARELLWETERDLKLKDYVDVAQT